MKVIIGTDSLQSPLTGVGRYTFELCKRLLHAPGVSELDGFDFGKFHSVTDRLKKIEESDSKRGNDPGYLLGHINLRTSLSKSRFATRLYQEYATRVCGLLLQRKSADLFHSPNFHLPHNAGKSVITIHDISYLLYPEYHPRARVEWMSSLVPSAIQESSHILCVSESTKNAVIENYHVDPAKVSVTYLGADEDFRVRSKEKISRILDGFGLNFGEYLLCVATIEPRKNIEAMIDSYLNMTKATRMKYPLVLIGGFGWHCEQLKSKLKGLLSEGVIHLGYVSQDVLPFFYSGARCLVYPSFYEGFGLPVLEAQASGTAVIASKTTSIPEVASPEAILIDPEDSNELLQAMNRAIEDEGWLQNCSKAGLVKAAGFSWDKCAEETVQVYQQVSQKG